MPRISRIKYSDANLKTTYFNPLWGTQAIITVTLSLTVRSSQQSRLPSPPPLSGGDEKLIETICTSIFIHGPNHRKLGTTRSSHISTVELVWKANWSEEKSCMSWVYTTLSCAREEASKLPSTIRFGVEPDDGGDYLEFWKRKRLWRSFGCNRIKSEQYSD